MGAKLISLVYTKPYPSNRVWLLLILLNESLSESSCWDIFFTSLTALQSYNKHLSSFFRYIESHLTFSIFPLSISTTLSQRTSISSAECEAFRIVLPSAFRSSRYLRISPTPSLSRPFIGSSRISRSGFSIIACANPSRWRIQRKYFITDFFNFGSKPTSSILIFITSMFKNLKIFSYLNDTQL